MSDSQRRGFVPTRSLTGGGSGALRHKLYHTSANRSTPIFLGDAVSLSGGELIDQSRVGAVAWLNVSANSQSSATGISKTCVNLTSAAGGNPLFRVVGLAPGEVAVTADGSLNNQVEVIAIDGIYRSH
jgi:hypothetical protein